MYTLHAQEFFHTSSDTVAVEQRTPQDPFPEHTHEFGEIAIVAQGGGIHVINDRPSQVCAGSILFLRPQDCHAFHEVNNLYLTNIIYRLPQHYSHLHTLQNSRSSEAHDWQISSHTLSQVTQLLTMLSTETLPSGPIRNCYREGVFLQLIALLWQDRYCITPTTNLDYRIRDLIHFLRCNYADPVDWHELAARFSLSPRTLWRKIKDQTGDTPQHYLTRLRLNQASIS